MFKKVISLFITLLAICATALASAENPTNTEVMEAYKQASTIYNWFNLNSLPTAGRMKKEAGYMIYYNVSDPKIRTMASLRGTMNTVFTPELTNKILGSSRTYREFGGALYVAPASRGQNIYAGKTTYKVVHENADYIKIQASTEIYEDPTAKTPKVIKFETKDFAYIKTPAGWRFATFTSVK